MEIQYSLSDLGWQHYFQQQLSLDELETCTVARVTGLERSVVELIAPSGQLNLPLTSSTPVLAVGDWILINTEGKFYRLLDRFSLFSRKAAGTKVDTQLIASNVNTLFIVTSMNADFNLNRIERYLALANEAGAEPVVVLTKVDCCDNPNDYTEKSRALNSLLDIVAVNSLDITSVNQLSPWAATGKTVAFLGSSGVGKSTLVNSLLGKEIQRTNAIREDDEKGRHTTTNRSLHLMPGGGLLLDTPGMRELQLADCEHGVADTFPEITELATQCKFSDCQHNSEPGCAIRAAIEAGKLDERRLSSYRKLMREQALNQATVAEKRARDRALGKYYRTAQEGKRKNQ